MGANTPNIIKWESSPIALASGANNDSAPHGKGRTPFLWTGVLRCVTPEFGYAVDDEYPLDTFNQINAVGTFQSYATSTVVGHVRSTTPRVADRTTVGTMRTVTLANWRLVFKAIFI